MKAPNRKIDLVGTLAALAVAVGALVALAVGDRALAGGKPVTFTADAGTIVHGVYYPGSEPAGILLLEGFGSDQVTLRSVAVEFARAGVHVFTFDFSGHGRSPGGLDFDNAATDRLARQVLAAKALFKAEAGLDDGQVVLLGHSMGARVALQAATLDAAPVAGLVLLGAQVNLATNVQSELFTGVSDTDLPWVQALGPQTPDVTILLVSGLWDDILTPAGADLLLTQLAGQPVPNAAQSRRVVARPPEGSLRARVLLPHLFHNYEVFSPRALSVAKTWAGEQWGLPLPPDAPQAARRILFWCVALGGIFVTLFFGQRLTAAAFPEVGTAPSLPVAITGVRRFLWAKLWLWLAALPLMALVFGLYILVPLHLPVFNLIYVGFIGGYGILTAVLYRIGKMPRVAGRLGLGQGGEPVGRARTGWAFLVMAGMFVLTACFARSGWFYVPPTGERLAWLALFTPPTALGFWMGLQESRVLDAAAPGRGGPKRVATLIGLLPFFLFTIFQAAIGSLSGMVGGVQGVLILALALMSGAWVHRLTRRPWLTAIFQAVLLYWLVMPQGVLF